MKLQKLTILVMSGYFKVVFTSFLHQRALNLNPFNTSKLLAFYATKKSPAIKSSVNAKSISSKPLNSSLSKIKQKHTAQTALSNLKHSSLSKSNQVKINPNRAVGKPKGLRLYTGTSRASMYRKPSSSLSINLRSSTYKSNPSYLSKNRRTYLSMNLRSGSHKRLESQLIVSIKRPIVQNIKPPLNKTTTEPLIVSIKRPIVQNVKPPLNKTTTEPLIVSIKRPIVQNVKPPSLLKPKLNDNELNLLLYRTKELKMLNPTWGLDSFYKQLLLEKWDVKKSIVIEILKIIS